MPIIATNFTKLNVEKKNHGRKLTVKNNINITDIKKLNLQLGEAKQEGLRFMFKHETYYEPNAAHMIFEGEVLFLGDKDAIQEVQDNWKAKKPINDEIMAPVMNSALQKSTIKALQLSIDMGLPTPIKLPRIISNDKKGKQ